jgi:ubiquinone/menaquinone biosynthesis C-methylase UbiE
MGWLNADKERLAVQQLGLKGAEAELELGFGSGVGLRELVRQLPQGSVAGAEPSSAMRAQALARFARTDRASVQIRNGSSSRIPWPDNSFDAVVSVNNLQFWRLPEDLSEVARVLQPAGRLSVAVHAWSMQERLAAPSPAAALDRLSEILAGSGFTVLQAYVGIARSRAPLYLLTLKTAGVPSRAR